MQRSRNNPAFITLEECMNQNNGKKQKRRLSAEEKWQIYRECEQPGAKVGEILRKYGLYSSDLQNIRKMVKEGSLERLSQSKPGRKKVTTVSIKDYEQRDLSDSPLHLPLAELIHARAPLSSSIREAFSHQKNKKVRKISLKNTLQDWPMKKEQNASPNA